MARKGLRIIAAGICQKIPHCPTVNFLLLKPIYSHLRSLSRSQYSHIVTAVGHVTHLYPLCSPITSLKTATEIAINLDIPLCDVQQAKQT